MNTAFASVTLERELLEPLSLHHGVQNRVGVFRLVIRRYLGSAFGAVECAIALDFGEIHDVMFDVLQLPCLSI